LAEEKSFCEKNDIEFVSFPIKDRSVPEDRDFLNLISKLYQKILQGKKIYFIVEEVLEELELLHPVYLSCMDFQEMKHFKWCPKREAFKSQIQKNKGFGSLKSNRD